MKFEKLCVQKSAAFLIFDGRHKEYNTYVKVHYSITVHSPFWSRAAQSRREIEIPFVQLQH